MPLLELEDWSYEFKTKNAIFTVDLIEAEMMLEELETTEEKPKDREFYEKVCIWVMQNTRREGNDGIEISIGEAWSFATHVRDLYNERKKKLDDGLKSGTTSS